MAFWVYILRCSDGSYYTGHTDNLEKRIAEHQSGAIQGYTSTRLPGCRLSLFSSKIFLLVMRRLQQNSRSRDGAARKKKP